MLTSASNVAIKDSSPTDYLSQLIAADGRDELPSRLESFLVSEEALNAALKNDYEGFLDAQSETLQKHALDLCGEPIPARTPNRLRTRLRSKTPTKISTSSHARGKVPEAPPADLVELLQAHNVGCVVEGRPGEFTDITRLGRCP